LYATVAEEATVVAPRPVPSHTWTGFGLADTVPLGTAHVKLTEVAGLFGDPFAVTVMLDGALVQPLGIVSDRVPVTVVAPLAWTAVEV
jgi:hypothetical protein